MKALIKFEKEIDTCLSCPFSYQITNGSPCSMIGEYYELKCSKLERIIGKYNRDQYIKYDFTVEIPIDCPFIINI